MSRKTFQNFIYCLLLLPFSRAVVIKRYAEKSEFQNKLFSSSEMVEINSESLIQCAIQCTNKCSCFGFNDLKNTCRVYEDCNFDTVFEWDTGWVYHSASQSSDNLIQHENCNELYHDGYTKSGVYTLYPWVISDPDYRTIRVYCDMETAGGGWTVVQRRLGGSLNFTRDWNTYKLGFGSPEQSYWIGNDALHQLTKKNVSLYVSIADVHGSSYFKMYPNFSVESETTKYRLRIGGTPTGTLIGNGLITPLNPAYDLSGMSFTTFDQDNDMYIKNCAAVFGGGWWFNACHFAFLNGPMSSKEWISPWNPPFADGAFLNQTLMMIKPY